MSIEDVARSFSGHRFEDAFDSIAEDATWHLVGHGHLHGRDAIVEACRGTATDNAEARTSWLRFVSTAASPDGVVAVDAVGRYTGPDGAVSTVSSCDVYEFDDEHVVRITSYTVELAADDPAAQGEPLAGTGPTR